MTHDDLEILLRSWNFRDSRTSATPWTALSAVVSIHRAVLHIPEKGKTYETCQECDDNFPCLTIRSIVKELHV